MKVQAEVVEVVVMVRVELSSNPLTELDSILVEMRMMKEPPILVGGSVRSHFDLLGFHDYDWLCLSKNSFLETLEFFRSTHFEIMSSTCRCYSFFCSWEAFDKPGERSEPPHQVHVIEGVNSIESFLAYSDFTVSSVCMDIGKNVSAHKFFERDVKERQLNLVNGVRPLHNFDGRIQKYMNLGYKPSVELLSKASHVLKRGR